MTLYASGDAVFEARGHPVHGGAVRVTPPTPRQITNHPFSLRHLSTAATPAGNSCAFRRRGRGRLRTTEPVWRCSLRSSRWPARPRTSKRLPLPSPPPSLLPRSVVETAQCSLIGRAVCQFFKCVHVFEVPRVGPCRSAFNYTDVRPHRCRTKQEEDGSDGTRTFGVVR